MSKLKRKFKPYLTIDRHDRLVSLLNKYTFPSDNHYEFSEIELQTEEDIKEEIEKIKKFYDFNPKVDWKDFVDDTLFTILSLCYFREKAQQFFYIQKEFSRFNIPKSYIEKIGINYLKQCILRYLSDPASFINLHNIVVERTVDYFLKYYYFMLDDRAELNDDTINNLLVASFCNGVENRISLYLNLITSSLTDFKLISLFLNSSETTLPYNEIIDQDCSNLILICLSQNNSNL